MSLDEVSGIAIVKNHIFCACAKRISDQPVGNISLPSTSIILDSRAGLTAFRAGRRSALARVWIGCDAPQGSRRKGIDLTSRRSEGVPDRDLGMLVTGVIGRGVVHDHVLVRRHGQPDMDLEAGAVAMLVARGDDRDAAGGDAPIVGLEALDLGQDLGAGGVGRFRAFEGDLRVDLHGMPFGPEGRWKNGWSAPTAPTRSGAADQVLLGYLNSGAALSCAALASMLMIVMPLV